MYCQLRGANGISQLITQHSLCFKATLLIEAWEYVISSMCRVLYWRSGQIYIEAGDEEKKEICECEMEDIGVVCIQSSVPLSIQYALK